MRPRPLATTFAINGLLFAVAAVILYPFALMVFGSLKSAADLAQNPLGLPSPVTVQNYLDLASGYTGGFMIRGLINSVAITFSNTALTVFVSALAAYAFAKLRFPGRELLFAALLASMLIPVEVNIPPLYILFARIGWLNTYQVQILPSIANVFVMFFMRQYMQSLPNEILESARLDGAGQWTIFRRIVVPLSAPVIGAGFILVFLGKFTEYLWPQIMVSSSALQPIFVLIPTLSRGPNSFIIPYELVLAAAVVVTIPMIVPFIRYRRQLMSGTIAGGVRG
jgi:ABC-type glycerol-3-phosphate transport system permease component